MELAWDMATMCTLYLESCEQYENKEALPLERGELLGFAPDVS
jgi:hypothetical protein